jgi:ribosome maturation factor RimP
VKTLVEQIEALITPSLSSMGFELVQVKFMDGKQQQTLQIMAQRPDGTISLDDCADISRQVSAVLDVEDIIQAAYRLEVSSPGIDRPLVKLSDYKNYLDHTAKVETVLPVDGRKRFTGTLKSVQGENIILTVDGRDHTIPFTDIQTAKLVLTDALIKAHQARLAS